MALIAVLSRIQFPCLIDNYRDVFVYLTEASIDVSGTFNLLVCVFTAVIYDFFSLLWMSEWHWKKLRTLLCGTLSPKSSATQSIFYPFWVQKLKLH